jgi:hypothetical protein
MSAAATTSAAAGGTLNLSDPNVKAVDDAFTAFFDPKTPASQRADLLQNGPAFAPVFAAQANNPMASQTSATVSSITLTDPTHAAVTYTILAGGNPVLPNQQGQAINEGGHWKVSDATFCTLLAMQGPKPPMC